MSGVPAFEFSTTPLVLFGEGRAAAIGEQAARFGHRALLVTSSRTLERTGAIERATRALATHGVETARWPLSGEPDVDGTDAGARAAIEAGCDVVIGMGGGSALDAAKAIACLAANGGEALDYLEVIGRGRALARPSLPVIAVPTTAGTGSEVTRNAVIGHPPSGTKASIRHEFLLPRVAILDPLLTHAAPPAVTAGSGLDALIQLVEPYVSRRDHPLVDAIAPAGIRRAVRALPRAFADGSDAEARADLLLAAHWSGMALAHSELGAAHALAGPLGGSFPIPHGFACAATIAAAMETNVRIAERDGRTETLRRYAEVAEAMGESRHGGDGVAARRGVERMRDLVRALEAPALGRFGVTRAAIPDLVARAQRTSSMRANPVDLDEEQLAAILEASI